MADSDLPPLAGAASRVIRIFISSTFRDMRQERYLLVKQVFPELRCKCARCFVTLTEVDLRWGITEEQANEGQVLPYCLAEIERSRPYFLGLLGERYGWIPHAIRPEIIEREIWLKEHVQDRSSVTELEILHGVLNDPAESASPEDFLRRLLGELKSRFGLPDEVPAQPDKSDGPPLPRACWSPLLLAMELHLRLHGGLFAFGHGFLRQVVESAFLPAISIRSTSELTLSRVKAIRKSTGHRTYSSAKRMSSVDWRGDQYGTRRGRVTSARREFRRFGGRAAEREPAAKRYQLPAEHNVYMVGFGC